MKPFLPSLARLASEPLLTGSLWSRLLGEAAPMPPLPLPLLWEHKAQMWWRVWERGAELDPASHCLHCCDHHLWSHWNWEYRGAGSWVKPSHSLPHITATASNPIGVGHGGEYRGRGGSLYPAILFAMWLPPPLTPGVRGVVECEGRSCCIGPSHPSLVWPPPPSLEMEEAGSVGEVEAGVPSFPLSPPAE